MKKIMAIGCPGSGKRTFSRALQGRTAVEKKVLPERLSRGIQKEEWSLDGKYNSTIERRLQSCDTMLFPDYPAEI